MPREMRDGDTGGSAWGAGGGGELGSGVRPTSQNPYPSYD